ncbi:MAG: DUF6282 family protein, partial [Planctomycetota bacterium]
MSETLLHGAWDIHLHAGPDVVPRADDVVSLATSAKAVGMAGLVLKDHNGCSVGRAATAEALIDDGPRLFGSVTLNPAVGGLNPCAVDAALRQGASIVWLPTGSARHHLSSTGLPARGQGIVVMPERNFTGYEVLDASGRLLSVIDEIISLVRDADAVLGTGHLSPAEAIAVAQRARELGLERVIATHVSLGGACGFSLSQQEDLVATGAWIEQSFLAMSPLMGQNAIRMEPFADQVRHIGPERVILSTDFGQVGNGPIVQAFGAHLARLRDEYGFGEDELRRMTASNPARLFDG